MPTQGAKYLKEKVRALPHTPGVYLMKDRLGGILYVGKAKDLKKRVGTYFQPSRKFAVAQPKVAAMLDLIHDVEVVEVHSETEALLLEGKLIKEWKPKYNTDFTDNKQFLLVRVDVTRPLPRFRLTRNRRDDGCRYYGPFVHSSLLRRTLSEMRMRFGILLADASPVQLSDGRWQLYDDARSEIYGQTEPVDENTYRQRVDEACAFLEGKAREWLAGMEEAMRQAAEDRDYERAADLRDRIRALRGTLEPGRKFTRSAPLPRTPVDASGELASALGLKKAPETMECFDISHISGSFVVASMVHFRGGKPDKKQYRRFKIRSFEGNDDYRAMEEVVSRRYRRLAEGGLPFPDLVVIDGGLGQVHAALKAFLLLGITPPPLIGLAKKEETIVFSDGREPLCLPHHSPALHLLQRLRDEAHRFANSFNAEWRSRKIRESILDDFPGLGPVRRAAIWEHFKTLDKLRKADVEEIRQVPGLGPRMAVDLHRFLHRA